MNKTQELTLDFGIKPKEVTLIDNNGGNVGTINPPNI